MRRLTIVTLAVMSLMLLAPVATAQTTPPNIVVILADDMRFDLMDNMPVLQSQLVAKGRSFTKGFIVDPVCCPSRASFLRGQYAHTTSVYNIDGEWGGRSQLLEADVEDEMLNVWLDPAYQTALVGKYLNGFTATAPPGPPGSWDYVRAFRNPGYNAGTWTYTDGTTARTGNEYSTHFMNRAAVEAIDTSGSEPVFLWYGPYAPHNPSTPEPKYANETAQCDDVDYRSSPSFNEAGGDATPVHGLTGIKDKSRWLRSRTPFTPSQALEEGRTRPIAACRSLLTVDDGIADIVAALERKDPGLENTIIVFTSDQGIQYGEHNWSPKKVPYEGTIHVPFVIRADGLFGGARSTDSANIVLNIDLAPTLLELSGQSGLPDCPTQDPYRTSCEAHGGGFDGLSLTSLLSPTVTPMPGFSDRTFLIEMWDSALGFPEYCAVRTADAKLIRYDKDAGADFEGYNLAKDPHELHSLVYSGTAGIARFRGEGQALYDELYPQLASLCDPLPPGYLPF